MIKKSFAAIALLCALPALADSWDSNANIERAMNRAVAANKKGGAKAMVEEAQNCHAGLDYSYRNHNAGRDVEYCIAMEISASMIDKAQAMKRQVPRHEYLSDLNVVMRSSYLLERAKLVSGPRDFELYLIPRMQKIGRELPGKL